MKKVEKILEEIDKATDEYGMVDYINDEPVISKNQTKEIIRKHMNDGWIPVKERLPKINKVVLACMGSGAIDVAWHDGHRWKTGFSHADWITNVTAWRPLPEPYRPGKER